MLTILPTFLAFVTLISLFVSKIEQNYRVAFLYRIDIEIYIDQNHDLAIAKSSSSQGDPGLGVTFKCLNF